MFFTLRPGKDRTDKFREGVNEQDVPISLKAGRALLDSYAKLPSHRLREVTEAAKAAYEWQIASLKKGVVPANQDL